MLSVKIEIMSSLNFFKMINKSFKLLNCILFKYILPYIFSILICEPCNLGPASAKHLELECKPQDRSSVLEYWKWQIFQGTKAARQRSRCRCWGQEPGTREVHGK